MMDPQDPFWVIKTMFNRSVNEVLKTSIRDSLKDNLQSKILTWNRSLSKISKTTYFKLKNKMEKLSSEWVKES
jgi:hypothetical protein